MRSVHFRKRAIIAVGYLLGAIALYGGLPEYGAPPGADTISMNAMMLAFLLPTAAAVSDALLRRLLLEHPVRETDATHVIAVYDAIILRFIIFVVAVHAIVLLALAGMLAGRAWAAHIVPLMLGLTMIGIGNLLPRMRPNLAIGIRTQRTLSDRGLWTRIHRSTGYLLVAFGMVIVLSSIAAPAPIGSNMVLLVGPATVAGIWLLIRFAGKRVHA
jgi:SdpI/YhfL family protein